MKQEHQTEIVLKQTIENLIQVATNFDIEHLKLIYHDNMQVIMINKDGQKMISDKEAFVNLFQTKKNDGETSLNTWAEFNHIEVHENKGHVIVTRKINLTGEEQKITLSIDLIWEDKRWQVTREVIFTHP
ncbi:MAG: sucrose-6-phosphate hydrolase SacC (GH32 family) [Polaribacter sp.]|jgi:sucrose-6-phosphate hydrolase SacC (GH32 family)